MYMSIIQLNQSEQVMSRDAPFNEEFVHQTLLASLGHRSRVESQLLYRKDKNELCVYSADPLNQDELLRRGCFIRSAINIESLYDKIENGDVVKLFFRTAPSKKVQREGKRNSARVGLFEKADRLNWVERKLSESGVDVLHDICNNILIIENGVTNITFKHFDRQINKGNCDLIAYDYIVTVQVKDKNLLLDRVKNGIGPYRSYGCGMILIGAA